MDNDQYKIIECMNKLSGLSKEGQLTIIYQWVKQSYISLHVFKKLVDFAMEA